VLLGSLRNEHCDIHQDRLHNSYVNIIIIAVLSNVSSIISLQLGDHPRLATAITGSLGGGLQ
jgi:hypothetical protein